MIEKQIESLRVMLTTIVEQLVDQTDRVKVSANLSDTEQTVVFTARVATGEVGKIIGKQGNHASCIRTIMGAVAAKNKFKALLEIADDTPKRVRSRPDEFSENLG